MAEGNPVKRRKERARGTPTPFFRAPIVSTAAKHASASTKAARQGSCWNDDRARFLIVFVVVAGALFALYYFPRDHRSGFERSTVEYLCAYTRMASFVIGLSDARVLTHGNVVDGRFSMEIAKSCDAMEVNILFVSAMLAISAPWLRKAVAVLVGLSALVALNILRLFTLYWIGVFAFSIFEFVHYDVWPLLMVAFGAADFLLCAGWARRESAIATLSSESHVVS
jgi:exosortase/archaeosortase family protein